MDRIFYQTASVLDVWRVLGGVGPTQEQAISQHLRVFFPLTIRRFVAMCRRKRETGIQVGGVVRLRGQFSVLFVFY
jgi:hypothetical protein